MAIRSISEIQNAAADAELGAEIRAALREVAAQIDEYRHLGPNWDGEDALAIGANVATRTKNLLRLIAAKARLLDLPWQNPSVVPNPDGGLELTWENGGRWAVLVVQPGQSRVGCATQEAGAEPQYQLVPRASAIEKALWVLRA
jgi:hypothetical protein